MVMNNINIISPAGYQFFLFAKALLLGFGLGFLLDFYRSVRALINFSFRVTFFVDLFFWIVVTAISMSVLLIFLWGEVHLYTYVGITCGFLAYYFLLSRYLLSFWRKVFYYGGELGRLSLRFLNHITRFYVSVKLAFSQSFRKK